jgi:hypothetical protein
MKKSIVAVTLLLITSTSFAICSGKQFNLVNQGKYPASYLLTGTDITVADQGPNTIQNGVSAIIGYVNYGSDTATYQINISDAYTNCVYSGSLDDSGGNSGACNEHKVSLKCIPLTSNKDGYCTFYIDASSTDESNTNIYIKYSSECQ